MEASQRQVLLIGSMPFANEKEAMERALDKLGEELFSLPDGEIGERSDKYPKGNRAAWVQTIIDFCQADSENWEVVDAGKRGDNGFPMDYESGPRLKPKHAPSEMEHYLDFHWLDYFKSSYPLFKKLRAERGLDNLKFQVGLPTGLGATFPMMSPIQALRYTKSFNRRMAYEANEMLKIADSGDLIFQIEVPGEIAMAYQLPSFLVDLSLRSIIGLVNGIEPKAPFGIHLCLGDLNNEALTRPKTLDKMVHFSNRLVAKWPRTHTLEYLHFPLAEGADPPPLDGTYYQALERIELPAGVRFVAGFIHDKRTEAEHQQILQTIESIRGHSVDVACSCGLGRRTPEVATELLDMSRKIVRA